MRKRIPKIGKSSYAEKFNRSALKQIGVKRANARGDSGTKSTVEQLPKRLRDSLSRIRKSRNK